MAGNEETSNEEAFHPAVRLLLARMRSNPEEFAPQGYTSGGRSLRREVEVAQQFLTVAEKVAIKAQLREVGLNIVHTHTMKYILQCDGKKHVG